MQRLASDIADSAPGPEGSPRQAEAAVRAARRLSFQRGVLRPLGWAVIVVVVASAFASEPAPGLQGEGLGVALALCAFVILLALCIRDSFPSRPPAVQALAIAGLGAAGAVLLGLQVHGATELAAAVAVWMAVVRLAPLPGVALAVAITAALAAAAALAGAPAQAILAAALLCALLGLMAHLMKRSRESQDRTEMLLAQLEDAREEQERTAALAERGRIAGELHDLLAHSLSGAAIQLQSARRLAEREHAEPGVRAAIERASELVREGLASAREAVGALRGEELPDLDRLGALVEGFRGDMQLDVELRTEGEPRALPAEAALALYRGAQEALTNVARHAPRAAVSVTLRYEPARTALTIEDRLLVTVAAQPAGTLGDVGGGRGLTGMRERLERVGGHMRAGPTGAGWRVDLDVPA